MHNQQNQLLKAIHSIDPSHIMQVIQHGIIMENVNLKINESLENHSECLIIKNRIADAKIFLLILRGYLP